MNRLKKVCMLCALALAGFTAANAENTAYLKLNFKAEESPVFYLVANNPSITFDADNMIVSVGEESVTYSRSNLDGFEFVSASSGVNDLFAADASWSFDGNLLQINNSEATSLKVYDVNGRQVAEATAANGALSADLSNLSHGVYLVNLQGSKSFKIIK